MYTVKTKYGELQMPLSMENDILNKHSGKTAIVIANGPSTKTFLNDIKVLAKQKDKYCVFVCGTADEIFANIGIDMFKEIQPDFWIVANSIQRVDNYYEKFNRLSECGGILAFAIGVDPTMNLEKLLKIKYHCYNRASPTVSEEEVPLIQTYVQKYTNFHKMYSGGHTVAVHMVAFAILSGCKTIKICGVDLDYKLGYFDNYTKNGDSFAHWKDEILMDFKTLSDSAKNIGVEVINLPINSPLSSVLKTFPSLT
jgi:hypothetical protein